MNTLYIDTTNACQLKCQTCIRGIGGLKNTKDIMPLELFEKCICKAITEGYGAVGLYNWTEPFLNENLPEYIAIVKKHGLYCMVSSNLSLNPDKFFPRIEGSLVAGIDHLHVSVSGCEEGIYTINHRGGNINYVKQNLERIAKLKAKGAIKSKISLRLIKFDYNVDEEIKLQTYASSLGLDFEVIQGVGHPLLFPGAFAPCDAKNKELDFEDYRNWYLSKLTEYNPERPYDKGKICALIRDTVAVDYKGDVYLCCGIPNYSFYKLGSYLDLSVDNILFQRYIHPFCSTCGCNRYEITMNEVSSMNKALLNQLSGVESQPVSSVSRSIVPVDKFTYPVRSKLKIILARVKNKIATIK